MIEAAQDLLRASLWTGLVAIWIAPVVSLLVFYLIGPLIFRRR